VEPASKGGAPSVESEGNRLVEHWRAAREGREREEAFERIFRRYYQPLYYFFHSHKCPDDLSQELVQEAFVRVYRSLPEFRGDARFDTWLYQIAANLFRNTLRERSALKRFGTEIPLDPLYAPLEANVNPREADADPWASGEPSPLESLLGEERAVVLREAIQRLPIQMRRCAFLRIESGLRYREIATLMNVSIDTVKTHLYQARQKLKSELGDYFADFDFQ
jgi:RNA polymerase sigma-70 factor, ECF subfamily